MPGRIVVNLLVAPLLSTIATLPVLREGSFIVLVAYPLILAASMLYAPLMHLYISKAKPSMKSQVLFSGAFGIAASMLVITILFKDSLRYYFTAAEVFKLYGPYAFVGFVHALVIWSLYTFGPLRVARRPQGEEY